MATGMVGYSGREISKVAPNSPSEIVKAKIAAATVARRRIGRSIFFQTSQGEAPREEAAWRNRCGMEAMAGCSVRITNGKATSVCAKGTSHGEVSQAPYERINPSPSVTAEEPSGSIINGSRIRSSRVGLASANAAGKPRIRERITVPPAYPSELTVARMGGT